MLISFSDTPRTLRRLQNPDFTMQTLNDLTTEITQLQLKYLRRRKITYWKLQQVTTMLGACWPAKPVDAFMMHARSFGDDQGYFELAADFVPRLAPVVVINGGNGISHDGQRQAWPGHDYYFDNLRRVGIPHERIMASTSALQTREESIKFLEFAENKGWKRVVFANLAQYQLRGMLGTLGEIKTRVTDIKVFPVSPLSPNCRKKAFGQQGLAEMDFLEQCLQEWRRVLLYPTPGFPHKFATIPDLIEYLTNLNAD